MSVDLNLLRSLVVLAEEQHFGRAAERLSITQPALTQQIQRLETQLGERLFERTSRSVEATPACRRFAADVADGLAAIEGAVQALREPGSIERVIRVGHTPMAAALARDARRLVREAGATEVIGAAWEPDLLQDLRAGRWQAVVGHHLPTGPDIAGTRLGSEPLRVLVASGDGDRPIDLTELAGRRMVAAPRSVAPRWHDGLMDACRAAGLGCDVRVVGVSAESWVGDLVAALDDGSFALAPASAVPADVVSMPLHPEVSVPLVLAWRPSVAGRAPRKALEALRRLAPPVARDSAERFRRP